VCDNRKKLCAGIGVMYVVLAACLCCDQSHREGMTSRVDYRSGFRDEKPRLSPIDCSKMPEDVDARVRITLAENFVKGTRLRANAVLAVSYFYGFLDNYYNIYIISYTYILVSCMRRPLRENQFRRSTAAGKKSL